jgi:hypothetical protein
MVTHVQQVKSSAAAQKALSDQTRYRVQSVAGSTQQVQDGLGDHLTEVAESLLPFLS